MRISLCPQALYHLSFDAALETAASMGFEALELPVDGTSPWVKLEHLVSGGAKHVLSRFKAHGLALSAVSNHREGQLLLGPHHADTDVICAGDARQKQQFAEERLRMSARAAAELEVPVLIGFVGCEDYARFFPWPDAGGFEKMIPVFRDRMLPLLDSMHELGVSFAQEPHPKQIVYNTETAEASVHWLNEHPRWGFNLDPANLLLAGVDPVVFAQSLGERILHVHAKDGELVKHNIARSGLLANGPWDRIGRGFRFRVVGWGDVQWKALISELRLVGYDGDLAVENEDPIFEPVDGLRKAIEALKPLIPRGPRRERWW